MTTGFTQQFVFLFALLACCIITGCGGSNDSRPARVPVSGQVTLDGDTVSESLVVFYPTSPGAAAAQGTTDEDGRFDLSSFEASDGAVPGSYIVLITKQSVKNRLTAAESRAYYSRTGSPPPLPTYHDLLPGKYSSHESTDLSVKVVAGDDNDFDFELLSGS